VTRPRPATTAQAHQPHTTSTARAAAAAVALAPPNPDPVRIAPPAGAPPAIAALVRGANLISGLPYRWGGGHQSLSDSAFDCSGSVSYALNWAGMLSGTRTSGQLAHWGVAGPGRWLTVYANAEHTFLVVRGERFDTRGLRDPTNSRWQAAPADTTGYAARHWPGY
jgi:cell wall-associated NlpC family hydrolase